mgnify:CR=1 FL=1
MVMMFLLCVRAIYWQLYNIVITRKMAEILNLDLNNPYVEVFTIKRNEKSMQGAINCFRWSWENVGFL